ncbi:unnamed protein product [Callosobruchus maculatus]|uniref:Uncharacterized protein n=1 Tax=Callosobruchus maculatus TaxID=64391 RepID=A0A653CUS4_CALMS|nr:unnamed protein product [Callosobruchus maculatus]
MIRMFLIAICFMQSRTGDPLTKICRSDKAKPLCNKIYIYRSNIEEFVR